MKVSEMITHLTDLDPNDQIVGQIWTSEDVMEIHETTQTEADIVIKRANNVLDHGCCPSISIGSLIETALEQVWNE